jgi:hypothetical protein
MTRTSDAALLTGLVSLTVLVAVLAAGLLPQAVQHCWRPLSCWDANGNVAAYLHGTRRLP